eukprot:g5459.t1
MGKHTEFIARGLIVDAGRVLLCRAIEGGYSYLPGGHIEFGERASDALAREIMEETGLKASVGRLLLAIEATFVQKGKDRHELSLVFHVEQIADPNEPGEAPGAPTLPEVRSLEDQIEFEWVELAALPETDVRPLGIKAWLVAGGGDEDGAAWERLVARIETLQFTLDRMGEEIERLSDMASLGELSAMIAHEVRNLMTPVAAYAGSALNRPADQQLTRDALTQAAQSAMQAVGVTDAILDLAQAAGASIDTNPPRPIADLVESAVRSLADRRREVCLESDIEAGCLAAIDPSALQQTLLNLILNAIDASPTTPAHVVVSACAHDACSTWNDGSVVIRVSDDGPGLPEGIGAEIFDPFVSGPGGGNSRDPRRRVGLGLALCKRLIERGGGTISAATEADGGACFTLTLPRHTPSI